MILTEEVSIQLDGRNVKYYESLGYSIPRYYDKKHKRFSFFRGTNITIKVSDLLPNSNAKVLCCCDQCGKERSLEYCCYTNICKSCSSAKNISIDRHSWLGQHHSKDSCHKISVSKTGKLNPMYNHLLTEEDRRTKRNIEGYNPWRKRVLSKDKYTCQKCGSKEKPQTHHINNWSEYKEQRLLTENGVCLCKSCHKKIHSLYGPKTNRECLSKFLSEN